MTTALHARNPRTGRSFCAGFRTNSYRAITDNVAEVNCSRCARALGITPAAKPAPKHRAGTCQCCFNTQQVSKAGGKHIALHGYERPGHGYINGRCMGEDRAPFEVSCEYTKLMRTHLEAALVGRQETLAKLKADGFATLAARVPTANKVPHSNIKMRRHGYTETEYRTVEVPVGQGQTQNPFLPETPWEHVPGYEVLKLKAVAHTEMEIRHISADIAFLTEKITGWKQIWES